MNTPRAISQQELLRMIIPILKEKGIVYKKFKPVCAKAALGGERITSITSDGTETSNQAAPGDFIVKSLTEAGEKYIVGPDTFHQRYKFDKEINGGFSQYTPVGKVIAVEMSKSLLRSLNLNEEFQLVAPWKELEVVKKGDYLVSSTEYSEVYRIARKEFIETYAE